MEKPLIHKNCVLEKFPGKGGWTFARLPKIQKDKKTWFGLVKVRGTIDSYAIRKYHLMPIGNGELMLPVKAEIRKQIKKKEGDTVKVILYKDDEPLEIPNELLLCLQDEPKALKFFNALSESEKKFYIQWVYSAKKEETIINRMATTVNRLAANLKLYDKEKPE